MLNALGFPANLLYDILFCIPGSVLAITLHEYTKARCSVALGDPKPQTDGRVTLNPLKHIEPIGFICVCLWGMGWGKPVATMPNYYAPERRRKSILIVHIMPVVVNLLVGLALGVGAMGLKMYLLEAEPWNVVWSLPVYVYYVVLGAAAVNISFALGQCLPVYPMAGERVLCQFLKPNSVVKMAQYQGIWQVLLMIGLASGYVGMVVYPICRALLAIAL